MQLRFFAAPFDVAQDFAQNDKKKPAMRGGRIQF